MFIKPFLKTKNKKNFKNNKYINIKSRNYNNK